MVDCYDVYGDKMRFLSVYLVKMGLDYYYLHM